MKFRKETSFNHSTRSFFAVFWLFLQFLWPIYRFCVHASTPYATSEGKSALRRIQPRSVRDMEVVESGHCNFWDFYFVFF